MKRLTRRTRRRQIELQFRQAPTPPRWTALPEPCRQEAIRLLAQMLVQHARAARSGADKEERDE